MLAASYLKLRHSIVGWSRCHRWWLLLMVASTAVAGCRAAPYSAATMPVQLRVPPERNADEINMANMSGMGSNTTLIGPGDLLEIAIASGGVETKSDPMLARVSDNGSVNVPFIGVVPVGGVEPIVAGERIATASIERGIYRQPAVVVSVKEPAVNRVTVLGAVTTPGVQKLPRGSSDVLSAIASAGGFSKQAGTEVEIVRQRGPNFMASDSPSGSKVVPASYSEPAASTVPIANDAAVAASSTSVAGTSASRLDLALANPTRRAEYRVDDGDIVMVFPEKDRVIHVSGLVNHPDQFDIPRNQDVHVLDAIAMAGGIKSPVADRVYVIRRMKDKLEPAVIQVSISKAKRNGDENLRLTAGDLVSVESTPATYFVDTMSTFFHIGLGLGGTVPLF